MTKKSFLVLAGVLLSNLALADSIKNTDADSWQLTVINASPNYSMLVDYIGCDYNGENCKQTQINIDNKNSAIIQTDSDLIRIIRVVEKDANGNIIAQSHFPSFVQKDDQDSIHLVCGTHPFGIGVNAYDDYNTLALTDFNTSKIFCMKATGEELSSNQGSHKVHKGLNENTEIPSNR